MGLRIASRNRVNTFKNVSSLMLDSRTASKLSQTDLSRLLGYKNGQYISNVERGLCSIPFSKVRDLANIFKINDDIIVNAIVADTRESVEMAIVASINNKLKGSVL